MKKAYQPEVTTFDGHFSLMAPPPIGVNMSDFMWMRSPLQALDEIAFLIHIQASLKEQDRWLAACVKLGYVQLEEEE
tara:strand:- start:462 stop:692 length:231 start_codon:yes stop_codon:yes gene_type:complete